MHSPAIAAARLFAYDPTVDMVVPCTLEKFSLEAQSYAAVVTDEAPSLHDAYSGLRNLMQLRAQKTPAASRHLYGFIIVPAQYAIPAAEKEWAAKLNTRLDADGREGVHMAVITAASPDTEHSVHSFFTERAALIKQADAFLNNQKVFSDRYLRAPAFVG